MTLEQVSEQCIQNSKDIAALTENSKSAHKRIDENDRITEGIHEIAASVQALALQIKLLTERFDATIERMEADTKNRDERIEASLKAQGERIGKLEKEPADKWKTLVSQVIAIVVAGLVGGAFSRFL